jgi:hypothetical protein
MGLSYLGCVGAGITGAASVALTDGITTRVDCLNGRPIGRAVARTSIAGAAAYAASKLGAPSFVSCGILVGPLVVSTLDLALALIPQRRVNPPAVPSAGALGQPWGPRPLYALPPAGEVNLSQVQVTAANVRRPADARLHEYLRRYYERGRQGCQRKFCSIEEYLLAHGSFMRSVSSMSDDEREATLRQFQASEPIMYGWCYLNAAKMAMDERFKYFEGVASDGTMPVSHAWVSLDGKLIDPTWNVYGTIPATHAYFGVEIPRWFLVQHIQRTGITGPFIDDYRGGWPVLQGKEPWEQAPTP